MIRNTEAVSPNRAASMVAQRSLWGSVCKNVTALRTVRDEVDFTTFKSFRCAITSYSAYSPAQSTITLHSG